jgi:hypothetical protein
MSEPPEIETITFPDGFEQRARLGSVRSLEPAPGVFETTYIGAALGVFVDEGMRLCQQRIAEGRRIFMFIDASQLASYETAFRTRWGDFLKAHKGSIDGVHILFASKLVQMGIVIVNGLTGGSIVPYSDRAAFDRARAEVVERRRAAS